MRRFRDICIVWCYNDFVLAGNLRSLLKNWPDIVKFASIENKTGTHRIQPHATWGKIQPESRISFPYEVLSTAATSASGKITRRASLSLVAFLPPHSALHQDQWAQVLGSSVVSHYWVNPRGYRPCIQSQANQAKLEKLKLDEGRGILSVSQGMVYPLWPPRSPQQDPEIAFEGLRKQVARVKVKGMSLTGSCLCWGHSGFVCSYPRWLAMLHFKCFLTVCCSAGL